MDTKHELLLQIVRELIEAEKDELIVQIFEKLIGDDEASSPQSKTNGIAHSPRGNGDQRNPKGRYLHWYPVGMKFRVRDQPEACGTIISHDGHKLFQFNGKSYASLSKAAFEFTGQGRGPDVFEALDDSGNWKPANFYRV